MNTDPLIASLEDARLEIIPMKGVHDRLAHLPPRGTVTVTASPTKGLEPTLELAKRVAARGLRVVPHLAARSVTSRQHLKSILRRCADMGIDEAFVPAGDTDTPLGPYEGAADLLEEMNGIGHPFRHVGITGYPEGHPRISNQVLIDAMARKSAYATYIVSQICYDPDQLRRWVAEVRGRGVVLPIRVGLPGAMDRKRLVKVSLRCGLGDSVRFLTKQGQVATKMLTGYRPDGLVWALSDLLGDAQARIAGWHIYTFNEVERTEQWRQELLVDRHDAVS